MSQYANVVRSAADLSFPVTHTSAMCCCRRIHSRRLVDCTRKIRLLLIVEDICQFDVARMMHLDRGLNGTHSRVFAPARSYENPPHVYGLAEDTYRALCTEGEDQCVIIRSVESQTTRINCDCVRTRLTPFSAILLITVENPELVRQKQVRRLCK